MGILRQLAERLSRGRSFTRHLPAEFDRTPVVVSPDAALRYLKPGASAFDAELLAFAREFVKPGHSVWDVGANIGAFTFAAAQRVGPGGAVLSIEADIWLASLLNRSRSLPANQTKPVEILPAAITDAVGVERFTIAARGRASNALEKIGGRSQMGGTRETVLVPTVTLDMLLEHAKTPDVLKIDIEGAEVLALRGGARLLHEARPVIYIEVGEQQNEEVTAMLHEAGYALFDGDLPAAQRVKISDCTANTLAIPGDAVPAS